MKKWVILSDYGLDDACAAVYLLDNRPKGQAIDIIAVAGNSDAAASYQNAKKLLGSYAGGLSGVRLVDSAALAQPFANLPSIHGADGMGDLLPPCEPKVPTLAYADWLAEKPDGFLLVSLGPATVTLDILNKCGAQELLIMGGHIDAAPNFNGYEFNHYLDIPAFNAVLRYPHRCATLDTCRHPRFNDAGKKRGGAALLDRLIDRAIDLAVARHPDNCYIYDYIAVHDLICPGLFAVEERIDLEGNTVHQLKA
ncbi:MAG: nucleoside hydrolase [Clostridiales bacterium]|jgi:inosine-uridine nucleoside N-ribohydrolase|nr:nucleoside hydrolase [Clostridiales bacterium]